VLEPQDRTAEAGREEFLLLPRVGLFQALRRHWLLALFPVVVLLVVAGALAYLREPTYEAEAQLTVGRIDVSAPGALSGFLSTTTALAASYSRTIDADPVVDPIARRTRLSQNDVAARLSASAVEDTPVFRVRATGPDEASAVQLANLASEELIDYTTELNRSNPDAGRLLREFREATVELDRLRRREGRLRSLYRRESTAENFVRYRESSADVDAGELRVNTLKASYHSSQQGQGSTSLVQVLKRADSASSDRMRYLQIFVFFALLAGIILGCALALWRANRPRRNVRL
jgi:uncharacterized protein involved in exopolysaccharide biosynthesis